MNTLRRWWERFSPEGRGCVVFYGGCCLLWIALAAAVLAAMRRAGW